MIVANSCLLLILSLALIQENVLGFTNSWRLKGGFSTDQSALSMGGGRSPEEKSVGQRGMFKELRRKLNNAAEIKGFFEVGEGPVDIDLFCMSNKDGTQVGACPYTQFVQMVLLKKGLNYNVRPTLKSEKPAFLLEKHNGKMPCLAHKDFSLTESLAIAEYIEKTFPHSSLTRQGTFSYQEVLEKTAGFWPALGAFIKNKDEDKDSDLLSKVEDELDALDEIIRSTPGKYVCGVELTLADLYLLPQLFHAMVTMEHFKGLEFYHVGAEPIRPALENYLSRMTEMEEFKNKKAYVSADSVVYGWKVSRGDAV
jgi:glutathione S-transferase